jgi:hypothetical protein
MTESETPDAFSCFKTSGDVMNLHRLALIFAITIYTTTCAPVNPATEWVSSKWCDNSGQ